jgi:integrase
VDFGHGRRIWSLPVGSTRLPLTEELACRVLELVRAEVSRGKDLADALAQFQPATAAPNRCETKLEKWLEAKRREVKAGDRSPTYLRELERYAKDDGHFAFWHGRSIHEAGDYAALEDWSAWLADRGLGPKSRHNVMAAWRSFLGWLYRRSELRELPRDFPWPKVPEHAPARLSARSQRAVLDAIPIEARGVFLAMALLGVRPGEAVVLRPADVADGWLTVAHARKGSRLDAPVRGTKSGSVRRLPVPAELAEWIAAHGPSREEQIAGAVLFRNPRSGAAWEHSGLWRTWRAACTVAGVRIAMYNGTKHTRATHWKSLGIDDATVAKLLGHARGSKSTKQYAQVADQAVVEALKR